MFRNLLTKLDARMVGAVGFLAAFVGLAPVAGAASTYDLTPVTTGLTAELAANVPIILGVVGAIIALSIGIKLVRRFTH